MIYKFKSLGIETNFIMDSFLAEVTQKKDYFIIRTPKRPNYFWGNYILMKSPPTKECFKDWIEIFDLEIGVHSDIGYCAITFDYGKDKEFEIGNFRASGFKTEMNKVLLLDKVIAPRNLNEELIISEYKLSENIKNYVEVHFDPKWSYGSESEQIKFLTEQAHEFATLIDKNVAKRYGVFLNGKLIADLGIYWNDDVIRFNSVSTHPSYRRQGACSKLVYYVTNLLTNQSDKKIVMQADEKYHAAKIYESIGFVSCERVVSLEWKDDLKFKDY